MHEKIKNFFREGEIADTNLVKAKENLVFSLEQSMRDWGYVPNLDLEPQFTLVYKPDREVYAFKLTVYGTDVGREKAWLVSGTTNGKMILKSTQPSKPKPSLNTSE